MNHKDKQIRCKKCRKGSYQRTNDYLEMGAVRSFFSLIHYRCTHCRTKRIILQPLQKILLVGFAFLLLVTVIFISQSYLAFRKYRSSHQIQFSTINTPKQTTSVPIKETANRTEKKLKASKPRQDNLPSPAKPASAPTVETKPEEKPGTETEKNPGTETDQIKKNISTEPPPPAVDKQIDQAGKPHRPPAGQQPEKQKQTTHPEEKLSSEDATGKSQKNKKQEAAAAPPQPAVTSPYDFWLKQPPTAYTIQIGSFTLKATSQKIVDDFKTSRPIVYYPFNHRGKVYYPVIWGIFDNKKQARKAYDLLPAQFQINKPFIRKLADVQRSMQANTGKNKERR